LVFGVEDETEGSAATSFVDEVEDAGESLGLGSFFRSRFARGSGRKGDERLENRGNALWLWGGCLLW
jgi:hypothetical protein